MIGAEKSVPITIAAETRSVHTLSRQEEIRLEFTGRMDRWVDRGKDGWMVNLIIRCIACNTEGGWE